MRQNDEAIKLARETLERELAHYLEKLWKIFSWTSTILISIMGGVIALKLREPPVPLSIHNKVSLTIAVIVLSAYAIVQLHQILNFETKARNKLQVCDEKLGILQALSIPSDARDKPDTHPMSKWIGYKATVVLLALAAVYTIVFG
jgi:hypothetical protein